MAGVLLCMLTEDYHPRLYFALLLFAVSWFARRIRIHRLSRPTPLDVPIQIFLLSLLISLFVAPDLATAFTRLTLFLAAISFFYVLTNSPSRSLYLALSLLIVIMAFAGLFLIGQYDWSTEATRFSLNKIIGLQLNRLIPYLNLNMPPWNVLRNILGSLLSLSLPILILLLYREYGQVSKSVRSSHDWLSARLKLFLLILLAFLILLDLLLTESRAPWVVYTAILALGAWGWFSQQLGEKVGISFRTIFLAGTFLVIVLLLIFINILSRNNQLITLLPGPDTFTGRLDFFSQSAYLAGDTPYTGGGLGAFTPLYSFYVRVVPFNAFTREDTGSDLYHYFLVEQGWLGLFSLIFLLAIPLYIGLAQVGRGDIMDKGLVIAGIVGISVILLRGFIHAVLGASRAIPFLLLPAGLIFAGLGSTYLERFRNRDLIRLYVTRRRIAILAVPLLLLLAYLLFFPIPRSAWYANLGAIRMAPIQLEGWPIESWEDGSKLPALAPAEALFQKSLALNPNNRTANHRLGLIYMLQQDFSTATQFLERAYEANPEHRGIKKSLGYSLVWNGEMERAVELLRDIPEAAQELGSYIYWWQSLGRPDLSDQAAEARMRLLENP